MIFLIEGEVVDTYGGDYTYRDVWYEVEDNEYFFYERYYGAKSSETERVTDREEIYEYMIEIIKNLSKV
jgi:hypothetical protein